MRTASLFSNNRSQAVRIPKEFEFKGVSQVEIFQDGDCLVLRPLRPSWRSLLDQPKADADFLAERPALIDEDRFLRGLE